MEYDAATCAVLPYSTTCIYSRVLEPDREQASAVIYPRHGAKIREVFFQKPHHVPVPREPVDQLRTGELLLLLVAIWHHTKRAQVQVKLVPDRHQVFACFLLLLTLGFDVVLGYGAHDLAQSTELLNRWGQRTGKDQRLNKFLEPPEIAQLGCVNNMAKKHENRDKGRQHYRPVMVSVSTARPVQDVDGWR